MLKVTHRDLIDRALAEIETLDLEAAEGLLEDDNTVFVDLRDPRELEREGKVPNAFHAPRGMLEFWVDPSSPYHKDVFASGKKTGLLLPKWLAFSPSHEGSARHGLRACLPYW